jgi:deoxycytidine triphosphate deaminase
MYLNDAMLRDLCQNGKLIKIPVDLADYITTSDMDRFQPASVELHLGPILQVEQKNGSHKEHDLREGDYTVKPGDFLLASTIEWCDLPINLLGRVEGKSSNARRGLVIHCTGGFIDPGFQGQITLEIAHLGKAPLVLSLGQKIAQLAVSECYPAAFPYGDPRRKSKYQNQMGPTPAAEEK